MDKRHKFTVRLPQDIIEILDEFREKNLSTMSRNEMIVMLFRQIADNLKDEE